MSLIEVSVDEQVPRLAAADADPSLRRLAGALDTVRRLCPGLPVLAIRWMHVKHPLHPAQDALLLAAGETAPNSQEATRELLARSRPVMLLRRLGQCIVYALYLSARLAHLRLVSWRTLSALKRQACPLIVRTWCFERERPADDTDFYHGDLSQRLARRGLRMLLLCGDVSGRGWAAFAKGQGAVAPTSRLAELCVVAPLAPLRLMVEQLVVCVRLRRLAAAASDPLLRRVSLWASQDCLAPDTALTGLGFWAARTAVRTWRPRAVMTLYEGHAWEQCFRRGVKAADPSCRTVGYQHTAVFPVSLTLRTPAEDLAGGSVPDVALCLGETTRELLQAGHARYGTRLIPFGSFRQRAAGAARPAEPARRTVLVTPEGYVDETRRLFAFASACARRLPSHTFVLRCHPEVPMAKALQLVGEDVAHRTNVLLSEGRSIEEDFARSSALLYRGSSTVLYAVLHGLLPVYVDVDGTRNRDPLFALEGWRERCESPEDLAELLARYEGTPPEHLEAARDVAVRYVQAYTGPVDEDRLEAFLESVGLSRFGA